jgi:glycosyltransferase involved in cell wall biosynthesis
VATPTTSNERLRIGIIAPPFLPIPPHGYAGTERVVAELALGLHARGHHVSVFAAGDSELPCEVIPIVPEALWSRGHQGDASAYLELAVARAWAAASEFDIIHSHVEMSGLLMARYCPTPVVTTLHLRLDTAGVNELLDAFPEVPLVAISESQRRWHEGANWVATIHHGTDFSKTPLSTEPGDYLLLVGRVAPEKGIAEAIEVARRTGRRLVLAAKVYAPDEQALFETLVRPAIDEGVVDWRGEIDTVERDRLMASALATLMLGGWPEPFGLVAIESMATGTPVIARRAGGVTETVEHGVSGFLVDDTSEAVLAVSRAASLQRDRIAGYARQRFSADRMTSLYEQLYRAVLAGRPPLPADRAAARRPVVQQAPRPRIGSRRTAVRPGPRLEPRSSGTPTPTTNPRADSSRS